MSTLPDHKPEPRYFREKIADQEHLLEEAILDVFDDVAVWWKNPRMRPHIRGEHPHGEEEIEALLRQTKGYDGLRKSIHDIGQLEHVYAIRSLHGGKHLVPEGGTRVTVLRELARRYVGTPDEARFRRVKVKFLPPDITERELVVFLARIHVRGTGVREWSRYTQAQFIYEHTTSVNGRPTMMSIKEMADYMGKSQSWVSRLRDAYEFVLKYVDYLDTEDAPSKAVKHFSILEEIIRSAKFGPMLKPDSSEAEQLRHEVFGMVANDVFEEYRDARHMRDYFDDPEKWARLKTLEQGIAHKLAAEVKAASPGIKGKIAGLYKQLERTIQADPEVLDEGDLEELQRCVDLLASHVAGEVGPFRLRLHGFVRALENVTLEEVKKITPDERRGLEEALDFFNARLDKHNRWKAAQ